MNKQELKRLILRLLVAQQAYGYEIIRQLSEKGVKPAKNYLYTILGEMEEDGLIKGEWVGPTPRKKHVFSLTRKGREEFDQSVKLALDFLMGAYNEWNMAVSPRAVPLLVDFCNASLPAAGVPMEKLNGNLVIVMGNFDPVVCYPNSFLAMAALNRKGKVYVVKDPEVNFTEATPNMVVMDGRRHDLPLKDDMADFLAVGGFPSEVTEDKAIAEWARVLKPDGYLSGEVMNVMIKEHTNPNLRFAEFVARKYYEHSGADRVVSSARVEEALSKHFGKSAMVRAGDYTIFHGSGKRAAIREPVFARSDSRN